MPHKDPQTAREYRKRWLKTLRGKYWKHKTNAKRRRIEWQFTYESWMAFWGADIDRRGGKPYNLCMGRKGDEGPYSPDNCYKTTMLDNANLGMNGA